MNRLRCEASPSVMLTVICDVIPSVSTNQIVVSGPAGEGREGGWEGDGRKSGREVCTFAMAAVNGRRCGFT